MDNWIVPMEEHTLNDIIPDNEAYFKSIAKAEINRGIIEKFNQIANEGKIRLVYVPGNHDMHFSEAIFKSLIPNGIWKGTSEGTGLYFPEERVVCEHGHNYDVFNAPDPLTTPGSILPPGYFISRIYATSLVVHNEKTQYFLPMEKMSNEMLYRTVWDIAVKALDIPDLDPDEECIVTGVDGYTGIYSINESRDIYAEEIDMNWIPRQKINGVFLPTEDLNLVSTGIFASSSLENAAERQYFDMDRADIVLFGHTHSVKLRKKTSYSSEKIYANTGAWCESTENNPTPIERTCIVIDTAHSRGSKISMVTAYQFTKDALLKNIGENYIHVEIQ
jgi:UDP-2,3-diacylglucosamine pyrophosphatase LpxH